MIRTDGPRWVNAEADALGSALALGLALRQRGTTVRVTFGAPASVPESLRGLDVANLIVATAEVPVAPELLIALDTASRARLGCLSDRVDSSGAVLVVDHHVTSERFGTHHLVDSEAEATVVVALRLIDALGPPVDPAHREPAAPRCTQPVRPAVAPARGTVIDLARRVPVTRYPAHSAQLGRSPW